MGTCIPQEILGPSGHLPLKQDGIESIRLVTGGSCDWNLDSQCPIALPAFRHLKRLSWSGLRSKSDFEALRDTFKLISNQLTELELNLICWRKVRASLGVRKSRNFFAWETLGLFPGRVKQIFPALQVLSLTAVPFTSAAKEMAYAFDFGSLRSLKLRFCLGWEDFLRHGSRLNRPTRLKSLEFQSTINYEVLSAEDSISDFLGTFDGLEQLAISTGSPAQTLDIWRAALHHKSTLRAFAHHQRGMNEDEDSHYFEEECDLPDLSLSLFDEEIAEWTKDPSQHPFNELNLEFPGLCCVPVLLV
jgi:hypothetical protein